MPRSPEVVDLEMVRHHNTEKSIKVSLNGEEKSAVWLPISRIEIGEERGRKVKLQVEYDLAFEKGLI